MAELTPVKDISMGAALTDKSDMTVGKTREPKPCEVCGVLQEPRVIKELDLIIDRPPVCEACRNKQKAEKQRQEEEFRRQNIEKELLICGVPPEFIQYSFTTGKSGAITWSGNSKATVETCVRFAQEPEGCLILMGKTGRGKCVAASDVVTLGDGSVVVAGDLIGKRFTVPTLIDGKVQVVGAQAEFNAVESVLEMETEDGVRVRRNAAHPFYAATRTSRNIRAWLNPDNAIEVHGWKPLGEIIPGMLVARPTTVNVFGDLRILEEHVKFLAYMIGDGHVPGDKAWFSQKPGAPCLQEFHECAAAIGCEVVQHSKNQWRVVGKRGTGQSGNGGNPALNLLRQYGVSGKRSRDKEIPDLVWRLTPDLIRIFLSRLFATDGWACVNGRRRGSGEIGYGSMSEKLVRGVQGLLQRFGVRSRIQRRSRFGDWQLQIRQAEAVVAFCSEVTIYTKEQQQALACSDAIRIVDGRRGPLWSNRRVVPGTEWVRVKSVREAGVERTVAIEVPETQHFVGALWEHNTHLAISILRDVVVKGWKARFVSCLDLINSLRAVYRARNDDDEEASEQEVLNRIGRGLLVLDDLGATRVTPMVRDALTLIVDRCERRGQPLIVTTNLTVAEIGERIDERVASRLVGLCKTPERVILLEGIDHRLKGKK